MPYRISREQAHLRSRLAYAMQHGQTEKAEQVREQLREATAAQHIRRIVEGFPADARQRLAAVALSGGDES